MTDEDRVAAAGFMIGIMMGLVVGGIVISINNKDWMAQSVENGSAEYDSKTGEWRWKKSEAKK